MSMYRNKPMKPYFSMAKFGELKQPPTITPPIDIVNKVMSDDGKLIDLNAKVGGGKPDLVQEKPKRKKKTYLPGEKLLKKLTNTKRKDDKMTRIKRAIRQDVEHLYACTCDLGKFNECSSCKARNKLGN